MAKETQCDRWTVREVDRQGAQRNRRKDRKKRQKRYEETEKGRETKIERDRDLDN